MGTVLLLGNGGREHAIALALKKSPINLINWAPKINPGIAELSDHVIQKGYSDKPDLSDYNIELAVIGPEAPLILGVTDWLEEQGISVFGPTKANARIEGSKSYMRDLLANYDVEGNIEFTVCRTYDELENALEENFVVAVKPDGLTGGKGVRVYGDHFKDKGEVEDYARELIDLDGIVLLEELLTGTEFTLQAFVNGAQIAFLPLVKDYKRAFDDDIGPNTGSMGSATLPTHDLPELSKKDIELAKSIVSHVGRVLTIENGPYKGFLYGQFMLTENGPKVVEFNARLGDPEAINALALLETPLYDVINSVLNDEEIADIQFSKDATVVVYLVPQGYPSDPKDGAIIKTNSEFEKIKGMLRYASVEKIDNGLKTTTSRTLAVIGRGENIEEARKNAYDAIPKIEGLRFRTDIASTL